MESLFGDYVTTLTREIMSGPDIIPSTIYFGGGTPSALPIEFVEKILSALRERYGIPVGTETTFEVNPFTGEVEYLRALKELGVNRVSIGVQSFNAETLRTIGRDGDPLEAVGTFESAREAGFDNISVDLIYGVPGQSLRNLDDDLQKILSLGAEHISAYQLTYTEGTRLYDSVRRGDIKPIGEDAEAEVYEHVVRTLTESYIHYEVSNFAREGRLCEHNVAYWMGKDYIGFGASAHSFIDGERIENVPNPAEYIHRKNLEPGARIREGEKERLSSFLLMRLRLIDREVKFAEFRPIFSGDFKKVFGNVLESFEKKGFIHISRAGFRVTEKGVLLLDKILLDIVEVI
jgi:oxygen-independent coproporphyrinogen-3 oxidase